MIVHQNSAHSVLIQTRSKAQIASSLAYKQDNVLALLYKAIGWTESGTDNKSSHLYRVGRFGR